MAGLTFVICLKTVQGWSQQFRKDGSQLSHVAHFLLKGRFSGSSCFHVGVLFAKKKRLMSFNKGKSKCMEAGKPQEVSPKAMVRVAGTRWGLLGLLSSTVLIKGYPFPRNH